MIEDLLLLLDQMRGKESRMIEQIGWPAIVVTMACSLGFSFLVAWLYRIFYEHRATGSQIHRAFPVLGVSITAIFISVQFSLPLSLGLLGALSIVRFRTPIKEPEEIAFLMLLIAVAIGCAIFNILFVAVVVVVAVAALLWKRKRGTLFASDTNRGSLSVELPADTDGEARSRVLAAVGEHLPAAQLTSISELEHVRCIAWAVAAVDAAAYERVETAIKAAVAEARIHLVLTDQPRLG